MYTADRVASGLVITGASCFGWSTSHTLLTGKLHSTGTCNTTRRFHRDRIVRRRVNGEINNGECISIAGRTLKLAYADAYVVTIHFGHTVRFGAIGSRAQEC